MAVGVQRILAVALKVALYLWLCLHCNPPCRGSLPYYPTTRIEITPSLPLEDCVAVSTWRR